MLIYFSLRDSDLIGSLKRKISEGKGKTKQQGGDGKFRPAEKFFEYKNEMPAGPRKAALRKKAGTGKSPGCSYQFYWLGRMIYGEVLAPFGGPENNHGEFDPGSE